MDARIRVLRNSVFVGQNFGPPSDYSTGLWGGIGPDDPFVIEAWPDPGDPRPASSQPRPIFQLPSESNINSPNFGNMTSNGINIGGAALCSGVNEWGGDFWVIGLEITGQRVTYNGTTYPPIGTFSAFDMVQKKGDRVLIEDCYVHDMGSFGNFSGESINGVCSQQIRGVTIRRNVIANTWDRRLPPQVPASASLHQYASRSGGIYSAVSKWLLIEENFMTQIGWSHESNELVTYKVSINPLGPKSPLNQALYIKESVEHVLMSNNVISEPSHCGIQSRGNLQRIEDNLVLEAPMGISMGHAQNQDGVCSGVNPNEYFWRGECSYNVVLNGANLDLWNDVAGVFHDVSIDNSPRGNAYTITRCKRFSSGTTPWVYQEDGYNFDPSSMHHNIAAHNDDGKDSFAAGIFSDDDKPGTTPAIVASYSANVHDNVIYNWLGAGTAGTLAVHVDNRETGNPPSNQQGPLGTNFKFENNKFIQNGKRRVGRSRWNATGGTWINNQYFSGEPSLTKRYNVKPVNTSVSTQPTNAPFASSPGATAWRQATGETTQAELVAVPPTFPDPTRNLRSYMIVKGLPINGATTQNDVAKQFMQLCKQQRKGNWNADLLANGVNEFIRDGFGM